jgi:hypothetical protein
MRAAVRACLCLLLLVLLRHGLLHGQDMH